MTPRSLIVNRSFSFLLHMDSEQMSIPTCVGLECSILHPEVNTREYTLSSTLLLIGRIMEGNDFWYEGSWLQWCSVYKQDERGNLYPWDCINPFEEQRI